VIDMVPPGVRLGIVRGISYGLFGKPDEFVPQLRELGAGLVRVYFYWSQVEPEPGRYTFDTVDAFLDQLDGSEEVWVTVCSSSTWATRQATELGQLAHHWYVAHDQGEALLASVQAGQVAEASFALAEAVRHYERALELWEQAPSAAARSPLDCGALLQRAAQAASLAGATTRAVALVEQALRETDTAAEPLLSSGTSCHPVADRGPGRAGRASGS
jgi:hypothetical protein